jgi:hypothetical protein
MSRRIIGALCAAALAACTGGAPPDARQGEASTAHDSHPPAGAERVAADELYKEPSRYIGKRVTVEAPLTTNLSETAFAIGEEGTGEGRSLLVVVPNPSATLPQRGRVTVSGPVQAFDRQQLRDKYRWLASTPEIEARYNGRPVIVAESILTEDGRELATPWDADQLPAGSGDPTIGAAAGGPGERPGSIHDRQPAPDGGTRP